MADEPRGYATTDDAQKANEETWRKFKKDFQQKPITYGAILVLIALAIMGLIFRYDPQWAAPNNNLVSFLTNTATEVLGVIFTIFVVNEFQKRRDLEQLKKELLADVKFGTNVDAIRAINRMRVYDEEYGWYSGDNGLLSKADVEGANLENIDFKDANFPDIDLVRASLQGAKLQNTNMSGAILSFASLQDARIMQSNLRDALIYGADLQRAWLVGTDLHMADLNKSNLHNANLSASNLQNVDLGETDLSGAILWYADLQKAYLGGANLKGAQLWSTNLNGADLRVADLSNANLKEAKLQNTYMGGARLRGANLESAEFSDETILPDDQHYDPDKGLDQLRRYTDPDYDGPGGYWDPCVEVRGSYRPWYCKDTDEPTP